MHTVNLSNRSACIASKPAPTRFLAWLITCLLLSACTSLPLPRHTPTLTLPVTLPIIYPAYLLYLKLKPKGK